MVATNLAVRDGPTVFPHATTATALIDRVVRARMQQRIPSSFGMKNGYDELTLYVGFHPTRFFQMPTAGGNGGCAGDGCMRVGFVVYDEGVGRV